MTSLKRTSGIAALALTATLGLAACGSEADNAASDATSEAGQAAEEATSEAGEAASDAESEMSGSDNADPAAQTYGEGCSAIPANGAGSFNGMATEPVATAASANPLLKTLVTAVGEADLVDTLNSAQEITVFAPTDDAFAAVPKKDLNALLKNKKQLTTVLSHHVVEGKLAPEDLSGQLTTLAGDKLKINGTGEQATIGTEKATVLCGNIPTANATVYVVDSVLMPAM